MTSIADAQVITVDMPQEPDQKNVVGVVKGVVKTKRSVFKPALLGLGIIASACVIFASGLAVGVLVLKADTAPTYIELNVEIDRKEADEFDSAAAATKQTMAEHKAPRYIKPDRTVWHNGTEHKGHVVVKLVDDRAVSENASLLIAPNPSLPSARRLRAAHAILNVAGLHLDATPVFPTHRRRKLQAADAPPQDPLHLFFELDAPDGDGASLCNLLNTDPSVELAYLAPLHPSLPTDTAGSQQVIRRALASKEELRRMLSPSFVHLQGYRGAAPNGFDFDDAAGYPGGEGAGITVADIEGGANLNHEDLGMESAAMLNSLSTDADWIAHGTAVWGEIKGEHDSQGVRGGAVAVTPLVSNVFDADGYYIALATVIADTADRLQAGDVMLIEQHYGGSYVGGATWAPVEYFPAEWAAIRAAVDKGIVVVEAGANGNLDLDRVQNGRFQRGHANFADSGAIMVGGARANQRTWIGSSYGSRIDVQGWYDWSVTTTGYGDLRGNYGSNDAYTDTFAGTSSASPLVTAAAAVMQSVARQSLGRVLQPDELRELIVKTGTPQPARNAATYPIGPQPNLEWALRALSNAKAQHGGCCQRSIGDARVAPWEYQNGVPVAFSASLASQPIACTNGHWSSHKTYSPATETCEDLRSFEVVSGSSCAVRNQCVYSNLGSTNYGNHEDCVIKQKSVFQLVTHSFDVEYNAQCAWDSLTVNGRKYCGTTGPYRETPTAGSSLVWHSDYAVTKGGFKMCPPNDQIATATLEGSTSASCQGTYVKSNDMLNGKPVWDRTTGARFIFFCGGKWRITGSQWRQGILDGSTSHCGSFISSANSHDHWYLADWSNNGAGVTAGA